ncbi:MAG: sugar kinase [Puia sp.]|nr:sugar kinase [Puia sp.]
MATYNREPVRLAAFGEFLLRLHCSDNKRILQAGAYDAYFAGAEANVCVLLARLGIPASYITRAPENDITLAGIGQLRSHGVMTDHILFGGDKLGIYFTEPGNVIRPTRVIYDRTGSSYAYLQRGMVDWADALSGATYFHWSGVAAAVSQGAADACAEALEVARAGDMIISSDFNYRTTLWKYGRHPREIMPELLQHSQVAVADLDSAGVYFGIETDPHGSVEERFRECSSALREKLPNLQVLAMSFRKSEAGRSVYSGALLYKGECYFSAGYELTFVADQIGAGDAFTGGLLYGLMNGYEPGSIIDFATACGALKQSIPGDWALLNKAEIELFVRSGGSGRIIR